MSCLKVVDPRNKTDSMAYIADVTGFQIIVFDLKYNLSWRTQSQLRLLDADSRYSKFTIASESFNLMDGIFGMAVSPKNCKCANELKLTKTSH